MSILLLPLFMLLRRCQCARSARTGTFGDQNESVGFAHICEQRRARTIVPFPGVLPRKKSATAADRSARGVGGVPIFVKSSDGGTGLRADPENRSVRPLPIGRM